jgi:hypothetical protein
MEGQKELLAQALKEIASIISNRKRIYSLDVWEQMKGKITWAQYEALITALKEDAISEDESHYLTWKLGNLISCV